MHRDGGLEGALMRIDRHLSENAILFISRRGQLMLDLRHLIPPPGKRFSRPEAIYIVMVLLRPRSNIRESGKATLRGSNGLFQGLDDINAMERRYADFYCVSSCATSSAMLITTDAADCCLYFTDPKALGTCIRNIHQYGFQEGMKQCMQRTD
jgi:hypothetical protein